MGSYTPNYNLYKPAPTDPTANFTSEYASNMDIIDANLGGGGGSGGHTIIDQSGNAMPSRTGLQFIGASVTDDSVNDKTVVTVTGGGGGVHYSTTEQVIGTWIDGKPLYQKTLPLNSTVINSAVNIDLTALTIDTLVESVGKFNRKTGGQTLWYSFDFYYDSTYWGMLQYNESTGNLDMVIHIAGGESTDRQYITLRYTKTTD